MAKGQKRTSKEAKKPKQDKQEKKTSTYASPFDKAVSPFGKGRRPESPGAHKKK